MQIVKYYGIVMGLPINVVLLFICWFLLFSTDDKLMNLHIKIISEYTDIYHVIHKIRNYDVSLAYTMIHFEQ